MFTGLITHLGYVENIETLPQQTGFRLQIKHSFPDVNRGESVAVDGTCLTALPVTSTVFSCDISLETQRCTGLGKLELGQCVNLERSLRLSDRIGGHLVTGHVDQLCWVEQVQSRSTFTQLTLGGVTEEHQKYLFAKASVAVQGVSLTVNAVQDHQFEVMLIPETLKATNLSELEKGRGVNIEFDMLIKAVVHRMEAVYQGNQCSTKKGEHHAN